MAVLISTSMSILTATGNHVWQSTAFAAAVAALAWLFRDTRAGIRYALWFTASVKFLIPFAAIAAFGARLAWRSSSVPIASPIADFVDAVTEPFAFPEGLVPAGPAPQVSIIPLAVLIVWVTGSVIVFLNWALRWRRIVSIGRTAGASEDERVRSSWERVLSRLGRAPSIRIVSTDAPCEPAVVGVVRPFLIWPTLLTARLSEAEIDAVLTHELYHFERLDNLAAAVHMIVEALFWFHPVVWWIESQLIAERERACDEHVIALGTDRQAYAESILKTCRMGLQESMFGAAGVTGSTLTTRIERIMSCRIRATGFWQKALLTVLASSVVAAPLAAGIAISPLRAQSISAGIDRNLTFEAAVIKPNKSVEIERGAGFQPGGRFLARNMTLRKLVAIAYGEPRPLSDTRVLGGPAWADTDGFDIEAKAAANFPETQNEAGFSTSGELMLRNLLIDRFKLAAHVETTQSPVFALVTANASGRPSARVAPSSGTDCRNAPSPNASAQSPSELPRCGSFLISAIGPNGLRRAQARFVTMEQLAKNLEITFARTLGRSVVDRTGLTGAFSFDFEFSPTAPAAIGDPQAIDSSGGVSIFTALQEQLGLKLESARGPVDVVVIDRAERLTDDQATISRPAARGNQASWAGRESDHFNSRSGLAPRNSNVNFRRT